MKTIVYNQKGEEAGQAVLPKEIFEVPMSLDLVHQVVLSQMANRRQVSAHTKDRAEVRGGGKKPWRQKGTGRARHGSIRSPLWAGGGVTFGPRKEKVLTKQIPKKMKRRALFMVLSAKAKEKLILVSEDFKTEKAKTKEVAAILNNLPSKSSSLLIALPENDEKMIRAGRNIAGVAIMQAKDLNALDLLCYKYLLLPKKSVKTIKETFTENSE